MPRGKRAKPNDPVPDFQPKRKYTRRVGVTGSTNADSQLAAITALTSLSSVDSQQRVEMIKKIVV